MGPEPEALKKEEQRIRRPEQRMEIGEEEEHDVILEVR